MDARYSAEFMEAVDWSVSLEALHPAWREVPDGLPTARETLPTIYSYVEMLNRPANEVRRNCGGFHLLIHEMLEQTRCEGDDEKYFASFLTLGEVEVDGVPMFGATREYLEREFKGMNLTSNEFKAHIWLTFPDHHIVDLTYRLWKSPPAGNRPWSWQDSILCSSVEDLSAQGIRYRPMLVSPDTVKQLVMY